MKYNDYVLTVARRFEQAFQNISAPYNFDHGDEFEIALGQTLRIILPPRFGVCRGHVVAEDGRMAGDDIIIFMRDSFPTLRMLEYGNFAQKEQVPLDAVCAYIEGKHSLVIEGDGEQSLIKAIQQVEAVQALERPARDPKEMTAYRIGLNETCFSESQRPPGRSPIFGAVMSRYVRRKPKGKILSADEIKQALKSGFGPVVEGHFILPSDFGLDDAASDHPASVPAHEPDLIVAGASNILLPFQGIENRRPLYETPFWVPGQSRLCHASCPDLAFGLGVFSLAYALGMAHLQPMPWPLLLGEAFLEALNQPPAPAASKPVRSGKKKRASKKVEK